MPAYQKVNEGKIERVDVSLGIQHADLQEVFGNVNSHDYYLKWVPKNCQTLLP